VTFASASVYEWCERELTLSLSHQPHTHSLTRSPAHSLISSRQSRPRVTGGRRARLAWRQSLAWTRALLSSESFPGRPAGWLAPSVAMRPARSVWRRKGDGLPTGAVVVYCLLHFSRFAVAAAAAAAACRCCISGPASYSSLACSRPAPLSIGLDLLSVAIAISILVRAVGWLCVCCAASAAAAGG
jgi:hypothetical protein